MTTISTSGIAPFSEIKSEHLLRIINALSGLTPNIEIIISGSIYSDGFYGTLYGTASNAIYSVNGIAPQPNGNVAVSLTTTLTGTSASLISYNTSSLQNGVLWIITSDPSASLNGNIYVFLSSSQDWQKISTTDQIANDIRYVQLSQTSSLNVSSSIHSISSSYYNETDPVFVSKSSSLATTGSNTFIGNQIATGSTFISGNITFDDSGKLRWNSLTGTTSSFSIMKTQGGRLSIGNSEVANNYGSRGIIINRDGKIQINNTSNQDYGIYDTSLNIIGNGALDGITFTQNPDSTNYIRIGFISHLPSSSCSLNFFNNNQFPNSTHYNFTGSVNITEILTLLPSSSLPPNPNTGSIAISGSGNNCKPYFYNGSWNALF